MVPRPLFNYAVETQAAKGASPKAPSRAVQCREAFLGCHIYLGILELERSTVALMRPCINAFGRVISSRFRMYLRAAASPLLGQFGESFGARQRALNANCKPSSQTRPSLKLDPLTAREGDLPHPFRRKCDRDFLLTALAL